MLPTKEAAAHLHHITVKLAHQGFLTSLLLTHHIASCHVKHVRTLIHSVVLCPFVETSGVHPGWKEQARRLTKHLVGRS
jgi:hypothetical protein